MLREPCNRPGWLHEIKHDGYRLVARLEGRRVRLLGPGTLFDHALLSARSAREVLRGQAFWQSRVTLASAAVSAG